MCAAKPPFQQALPGYAYQFPRDFYAHEDYRIEWWYYTGNLHTGTGREFGYQLTFFRVGLEGEEVIQNPSRWKVDQVYFAHFTVTDHENGEFHFFERINRRGLGQAGAASDALKVWNEDWTLIGEDHTHHLTAGEKGIGIDLMLIPLKPPVIHGEQGISRKGEGPGAASHYFSFTRMATEGTVWIEGKPHRVTGTSWMDHEFSSNTLGAEQIGWDWFSLKLDDGTELMLYQMRLRSGGVDPHSSGTRVAADGTARHLKLSDYTIQPQGTWTSPHTGAVYPAGWVIALPGEHTRLTVTPDLPDQELYQLRSISSSYWEGSVTVEGMAGGRPVAGKGYVELVGYQKALQQDLPK